MKISITGEAANWYKEELLLDVTPSVRFFVRYGGVGGLQPGFSLGVAPEQPVNPITQVESKGIQFFIESDDAWYFDSHDLTITLDPSLDEPKFSYDLN